MTDTAQRKRARKPQERPDTGPARVVAPDTPDTAQGPRQGVLDPLELQRVALGALAEVAQDANSPSAAKAAAARTLLEYCGAIGRHAPEPPTKAQAKPLSEMTLAELDAAIAAHGGA